MKKPPRFEGKLRDDVRDGGLAGVVLVPARRPLPQRCAGRVRGGVALFPTNPTGANPTIGQAIIGYVHLACAALFILCMAYFSLALLTRRDPRRIATRQNRQRNVLYWVCATAIVACLVLVVAANFVFNDHLKKELHPLLWLETVALWAFSVSWLVKGEFLVLKDESADRGGQGLR